MWTHAPRIAARLAARARPSAAFSRGYAAAPPVRGRAAQQPTASASTSAEAEVEVEVAPDAAGLLVRLPGRAEPARASLAWLLDTDQSERSVDQSTKQKFLHSTDNWSALATALQAGSPPLARPPHIDGADLVLAFSPAVQPRNEFSVKFCDHKVPPAGAGAGARAGAGVGREVRVPLAWLVAHAAADAEAYDAWHSDVLGLAQPWTGTSLGKRPAPNAQRLGRPTPRPASGATAGNPAGPMFSDWADIVAPDLEKEYSSTMVPCPQGDTPESAQRLEHLYTLVHALLHDGLAFVQNVPVQSRASVPAFPPPTMSGGATATKESDVAMLYHVARTLGEIRATFYGSHLWDVRSVKNSLNIAYTNKDLGFHADLCYFANPPRFQLLHMLHNEVRGGESLFVDGFAVAQELFAKHPDDFDLLTKTPVAFHYQNDGRYYRFAHPTIELAQPWGGHAGSSSGTTAQGPMPRITAINYSPPFQAPLPIHPGRVACSSSTDADANADAVSGSGDDPAFRRALQRFADLTHEPRLQFRYQMRPGDCVVFDNRRVLHSRTGFDWDAVGGAQEGEVKRWLKGTYVEGDAVWSTYRVLRARVEALRAGGDGGSEP